MTLVAVAVVAVAVVVVVVVWALLFVHSKDSASLKMSLFFIHAVSMLNLFVVQICKPSLLHAVAC